MKLLLIGYFSTVGDIEVLDVVKKWLNEAQISFDVSAYNTLINDSIEDSKDINNINELDYSHLVILCGPFWQDFYIKSKIDLNRFNHCKVIGLNLSMIEHPTMYNPFDVLFPRDTSDSQIPDLSLLYESEDVPVIGLCLAPDQPEYGIKQNHSTVNQILKEVIISKGYGIINMNTQWPHFRNDYHISSPNSYEAICRRIDVLMTTRLHGLVIGLKTGIPVIAVDPIIGGGKIIQQGKALNWPYVFSSEDINKSMISDILDQLLDKQYKKLALDCAQKAKQSIVFMKDTFLQSIEIIPTKHRQNKDLFPQVTPLSEIPKNQPTRIRRIRNYLKIRTRIKTVIHKLFSNNINN